MIPSLSKVLTFEEFLELKSENRCYELYQGVIVEMQPTGKHEEIIGFLSLELALQFRQFQLPYFCPKQALIKLLNQTTAYLPDVLVINREQLMGEPLWEKYSTLVQGSSVPLVIEVVSTNWRDDYLTKLRDYEEIGIAEYWIVDYLGLGGVRYIGSPKQPTISVYQLVGEEYQMCQFRGNEIVESRIFPGLNLRAVEVFEGCRGD